MMYVVLEGIDLVGKTTQIKLLKNEFKDAIFSLEPGATRLGQTLRNILLNNEINISKRAELLLFLVDRAQHYEEILSKNSNKLIISDRSFISGIAYADEKFDFDTLLDLNIFALNGFLPQKCVFLKADIELIQERLEKKALDNIEKRGIDYLVKVQNNIEKCIKFLQKNKNLQALILNARDDIDKLHKQIKDFIND